MEKFFLLGVGVWCFGGGLWAGFVRKQALNWKSTSGVITKSKIRPVLSRQYSEEFDVAYRFHVGEHEYYGNRLTPGGFDLSWSVSFPGISSARGKKSQYLEGSEVQVFYDPDNPNRSALERPSVFTPSLLAVIGALATFASLFLIL